MSIYARAATLTLLALVAGCGHNGSVPMLERSATAPALLGALAVVKTGHFTEYSLPANTKPSDVTRGPYDTIWFTGNAGASGTLNQLATGTGVVRVIPIPPPNNATGSGPIASTARAVWFGTGNADTFELFLAGVTPELTFTFFSRGFDNEQTTNIAVGSDGHLWSGACIQVCGDAPDSAIVSSVSTNGVATPAIRLTNFMNAVGITPGPGGFIYATATNDAQSAAPTQESAVFVISTASAIVHKFELPADANPAGIVTGADHNLWIAEPGINKIARMTPSGAFTQFTIPTANAGTKSITYGVGGVLWFTETNANKLGRITTAGNVTEFKIPTTNSGVSGITPCTTSCGTHGGVWFTETTANKIGRFNAPF